MSDSPKKTKKKVEKLRFVILNDETFQEKLSIRFSKNKMIGFVSGAIILMFTLFFLLIAFTPLKRLTPGYASIENNIYVIKMKTYVDDLEKQISMQEKYNSTLRKLLVGNGDSLVLPDVSIENTEINQNAGDDDFEEIYTVPNKNPNMINRKKSALASYYFIPPLDGKVINKVEFKTGHYGVDITGVKNAPIKATMEGIVVLADYTSATGYTIAIQHPNDMLSIYKHNTKLLKDIGNFVANGEAIAIIGNTGELTDGPHLHFELWYKSTPLNPEDYIIFN
jgi:murein DD-endopeptidase MepM/ murein hydrolase activator NlpD